MALIEGRYFKGAMTDKRYGADGIAEYCRQFVSSGIWELGNNLRVSPGEGLSIKIGFGVVLIDGYLFKVSDNGTGLLTLQLEAADTLSRIDLVVVRKDPEKGSVYACIKKGLKSKSPIEPALYNHNGVFEIVLAKIYVNANAVQIVSGDITDERINSSLRFGAIYFKPGNDGVGIGGKADANELKVFLKSKFKDKVQFENDVVVNGRLRAQGNIFTWVKLGAQFTSITSWQKVRGFTIKVSDAANCWNTSTDRFTAPVSGRYLITCGGYWFTPGNGERYAIGVRKNGIVTQFSGGAMTPVDIPMSEFIITLPLVEGDYLEVWLFTSRTISAPGYNADYPDHCLFFQAVLLG